MTNYAFKLEKGNPRIWKQMLLNWIILINKPQKLLVKNDTGEKV